MPEEFEPLAEILVPIDFSAGSINAMRFAMRIAAPNNARLHLLYVDDDAILMQPTTDQKFRDEHADKMSMNFIDLIEPSQRERFRALIEVRFGTAYHEILNYAAEHHIELIVMGNLGRSAIANALLGSVTAHVLRHALCPVLSVKV